jgi:hypothetical protein
MEDENLENETVVEDDVISDVELPVKVKKARATENDVPNFIRAENGDSYVSIALRFCGDVKPSEFARYLLAINNGAVVRAGSKIFLKENR